MKGYNGQPVQYAFLGDIISGASDFISAAAPFVGDVVSAVGNTVSQPGVIPGLISGAGQYIGAQSSNEAAKQANAINQAKLDLERQKITPIINKAGQALAANQYYDPYVQAIGQAARTGQQQAGTFAGDVGRLREHGLAGLEAYRSLAGMTPEEQHALAQQYEDPYVQATLDPALREINKGAGIAQREAAIRGGRFGALSGQQARRQAAIEEGRQRAVGDLTSQKRAEAYRYAQQAAQNELARRQGLASGLAAQHGAGQTTSGAALSQAQAAGQAGIGAPYQPIRDYAGAIQGTTLPTYTPQTVVNPLAAAATAGLAAYGDATNPKKE